MLRRADAGIARPRDHLAHVEMHVLAALGERAVERPQRAVADQQPHDIAFAARTGQRIEQAFEWFEHRHDFGGTIMMTKRLRLARKAEPAALQRHFGAAPAAERRRDMLHELQAERHVIAQDRHAVAGDASIVDPGREIFREVREGRWPVLAVERRGADQHERPGDQLERLSRGGAPFALGRFHEEPRIGGVVLHAALEQHKRHDRRCGDEEERQRRDDARDAQYRDARHDQTRRAEQHHGQQVERGRVPERQQADVLDQRRNERQQQRRPEQDRRRCGARRAAQLSASAAGPGRTNSNTSAIAAAA